MSPSLSSVALDSVESTLISICIHFPWQLIFLHVLSGNSEPLKSNILHILHSSISYLLIFAVQCSVLYFIVTTFDVLPLLTS